MRPFALIALGLVYGALDERELREKQLNASIYDPGVIPGKWRKENMGDFVNLGDFVAKKCAVYPDVKWEVPPGSLEYIHHFSRNWIIYVALFCTFF